MKNVRKIECKERDELGKTGGWSVGATLTDPDGNFGEPRIFTEWWRGNERVSDERRPNRYGGEDVAPCEHYVWTHEPEEG